MLHHVFLSLLISLLLLLWCGSASGTGFITALFRPKWHDALCCPVPSSRAHPWIVLHAATLLPARRPRDPCRLCDLGER
jgi:hypothetical protein